MLFNGIKMLFLCVVINKTIQPFGKVARKNGLWKNDLGLFLFQLGLWNGNHEFSKQKCGKRERKEGAETKRWIRERLLALKQ